MEKIESFRINHLTLKRGLYVSRRDRQGGTCVTTFDLRFTLPNREPPMTMPAVHTIEHLGATFLRNSPRADEVIYFGPMGCRTGFYLVVFGEQSPEQICGLVADMCRYILGYSGQIPGATPAECGNWSDQDLDAAKRYVEIYADSLGRERNFVYPM